MWQKRNLAPILQIALLCACIGVTMTMLCLSWIPPQPAPFTQQALAVRTELGDELAAESILQHRVTASGTSTTTISYRSGDKGLASYRADGSLKEFTVTFATGAPRLHAVFDWTGKYIIDGVELREDGTKVWTAEKLSDGKLKTVSYWKSTQTVFAEEVQDLQAGTTERTYYRISGDVWVHQLSARDSENETFELIAEEVYAENGKLNRVRKSPRGSDKGMMAYYRYDGTLDYTQHWGPEPGAGASRPQEHAPPPTVRGLQATNIYDDAGTRVVKQIGFQSQGTVVPWIALVNADGSMDVTHYGLTLTVVSKEHLLADGTITASESRPRRPERMEPFDQKYRDTFPAAADPAAQWTQAENRGWLLESMQRSINRRR